MFNRRHLLAGTAAMGLSFTLGAAAASRSQVVYTADTTPYASARQILRRRPRDLHAGSSGPHDLVQTLHLNFAKLIEYNFARLDDPSFERAWYGLTGSEAAMLAAMYDRSITDSGSPPRLLELVAERARLPLLLQVGHLFGSSGMEEALMRFAPHKLAGYRASAHLLADLAGHRPVPGGADAHPNFSSLSGPTVNYTLREIYLSYRTAPIGALGIAGSLYMATRYASGHLAWMYGGGFAFGTFAVAPLIREFAPALWNGIGATVHHTVEALSTAQSLVTTAQLERQAAQVFQVPSHPYMLMQNTGGDFGVVWAWNQVYGGDGGGNPFCGTLEVCPPMSEF